MNHPTLTGHIWATVLIQKTSEPILESRYAGQHHIFAAKPSAAKNVLKFQFKKSAVLDPPLVHRHSKKD